MAKDQSVAPKERVNITYKPATGGVSEDVELPLKIMVLGDFTGKQDPVEIEKRKSINIDKDNFESVLASQKLEINMTVDDKLSGEEGSEIPVQLKPRSMKDFSPDAIVQAVPELQQLMRLREALVALKHPIVNNKSFRKRLEAVLQDESALKQLSEEILPGDEPKGE